MMLTPLKCQLTSRRQYFNHGLVQAVCWSAGYSNLRAQSVASPLVWPAIVRHATISTGVPHGAGLGASPQLCATTNPTTKHLQQSQHTVSTKMHVRCTTHGKAGSYGGMAEPEAQQMAQQNTANVPALCRRHDLLNGISKLSEQWRCTNALTVDG
jgi:hypothetical protein